MHFFANSLTFILHPLLLLIPAAFLIIYRSTSDIAYSIFWTTISVFFAGVIAVFVLFGVKKGFFSDVDISKRRERFVLFSFGLVVTVVFMALLSYMNGPDTLFIAAIYLVVILIIFEGVNAFIKASIHVAGISAMAVGLTILYGGLFYFLLVLIPLVSWARIIERKHTLKETVAGAMMGSLLTLVVILVVQYILVYV